MEERHRECTSAQRVLSAQSRFARRKFAQQICMHAYGSGLVHTEGRHVKDGERGFAGVNEHPPDVTLSWMIMKCWARVGTDRRWIDTAGPTTSVAKLTRPDTKQNKHNTN